MSGFGVFALLMPPIGLGLVMLVVWLTYGPKSKLAQSARHKTKLAEDEARVEQIFERRHRDAVLDGLHKLLVRTAPLAPEYEPAPAEDQDPRQRVLGLEAYRGAGR